MTTDLTSDHQLTAIAANLAAMHGLLRNADSRGTEALYLIQQQDRQGAIGALLGLDAVLSDARALYSAVLTLHRRGATAPSSSSVRTARPSNKDSADRLIDTINNTGGLVAFADGTYGPQGEPDWLDLGDAYLAACHEKAIEPRVAHDFDCGPGRTA